MERLDAFHVLLAHKIDTPAARLSADSHRRWNRSFRHQYTRSSRELLRILTARPRHVLRVASSRRWFPIRLLNNGLTSEAAAIYAAATSRVDRIFGNDAFERELHFSVAPAARVNGVRRLREDFISRLDDDASRRSFQRRRVSGFDV